MIRGTSVEAGGGDGDDAPRWRVGLVPQLTIDGPPETVFTEIDSLRFESGVRAYLAMDFTLPLGGSKARDEPSGRVDGGSIGLRTDNPSPETRRGSFPTLP